GGRSSLGTRVISAPSGRRRPITAPRCAVIPATTSCSAAPSWRFWPMGRSMRGVKLAEHVLQVDKNDRIARLGLGARAIKQKQYPVARRRLAQSIPRPITHPAASPFSPLTLANPTEGKHANGSIDKPAGADWYAIFKELHAALILDVAGQKKEAAKRFERRYKLDPTALRVVQSYGSFLSRQGNDADALKVFAA